MLKIEKLPIEIKDLPPSFQGVKIAQLSDIHSQEFGERERMVLEKLGQINPDFVVITGDFVDWKTKNLDSCKEFWQEIGQKYSGRVFGVFGNHEHHNPKFKTIKNYLEESGIKILENETEKITKNEDFIYLVGLDDPHEDFDDFDKATKGIDDNSPEIVIAHSPEVFKKIKEKNVDLVLTGHTHGGQINIPFVIEFFLPLKYDRKYKSGLFEEGGVRLYVNRGVGTTFLPIRFNAVPEITLIELK